MRKTIAAIAAGAVLIVASALPAGAHHWDGYSILFCTAHKSAADVELIHSWPYSLEPGHLIYVCTQSDPDVFAGIHQFFVDRDMATNAHTRVSGYQWCGLVNCEPHGIGS